MNLHRDMIGIIGSAIFLYLGKVHFECTPVAVSIGVQHTHIVIIYKLIFSF